MAKRTPLWSVHESSGAVMAEFAGWDMPIRYGDIQQEHRAVRTAAGLFDVSHMGELRLSGPGALAFAASLITNTVPDPALRRATYSPMCHPHGGTVDDLFVYGISPDEALLVVNAGNIEKDEAHVRSFLPDGIRLANESSEWIQLALQGPAAATVLAAMPLFADTGVADLRFMTWTPARLDGYEAILSRSGYTGGDGFELYIRTSDPAWAAGLWDAILDEGRPYGVVPAGLGARDTLRLEGALPLYGHELTDDVSPIEANLLRFIHLEKERFIGREALLRQSEQGTGRVLAGICLIDRGIAREGCEVFPVSEGTQSATAEAQAIGRVTSGGVGVFIGRNIAMAYLDRAHAAPGTAVDVEVRGRRLRAEVAALPFYRKPKAGADGVALP